MRGPAVAMAYLAAAGPLVNETVMGEVLALLGLQFGAALSPDSSLAAETVFGAVRPPLLPPPTAAAAAADCSNSGELPIAHNHPLLLPPQTLP